MPRGMNGARPVAGYPTQTEAIIAMTLAGEDAAAIAGKLDRPKLMVQQEQSRLRRCGRLPAVEKKNKGPAPKKPRPAEDNRGLWTPEKMAAVRRVTAKAFEVIAEAYQVPAEEVLKLVVSGTLPPVGRKQRVGQLVSDLGSEEPPETPALQLPPPAPSREDDDPGGDGDAAVGVEPGVEAPAGQPDAAGPAAAKAEEAEGAGAAPQAAEAAAPGEPEGPPPRRYRLKQPHGSCWLHKDVDRFTTSRGEAWQGAPPDMERLFKAFPKFKDLDPERVP